MVKHLQKMILAVSMLLVAQVAFSQNITLKFTGATNDGRFARLDSVQVQNVSRSWSETVVYPDTVLIFQQTGITDAQGSTADIASYPNPFNGTTNVAVTMPQSGDATLQVYNFAGQRVAERTMSLQAGKNLFEVRLQTAQVYLLAVTTEEGRSTLKLLNRGTGSENSISYHGNSNIVEKHLSTHIFHSGDVLKIIGYITNNGMVVASREVLQPQTASENFTLFFTLPVAPVAPTVTTTSASGITSTTATTGGNVISDGGSAVTSRGVCWDTSQNPTLSNSHTTNGSGTGSFTSSLTGLTAGTTYYVRAYAINSVDTAYGSQITFTTTAAPVSYTFSVSSSTRVVFSPGNLQWSATGGGSTPTTHVTADSTAAGTWRFAPHQWDTIGVNNSNISSSYSGWIDLFGWGTSGWNNGNYFYQPYSSSNSTSSPYTSSNGYGYGPTDGSSYTFSLTGRYANADWGVYNAIYNPKTSTTDAPGTWRTLTSAECEYLINTRSTTSGIRYAKATVNGVPGLIIVPDNWSTYTYVLNSTNTTGAAYTTNVITSAQWTTLENAGCAFLPAAGSRGGTSVYDVGSDGYYWSATCYSGSAWGMYFLSGGMDYGFGSYRLYGRSVRLVKDCNSGQIAQPPTVTTATATNITSTTATTGGNVTSDGGSAVTARGVCWSTSQNPTLSNSHTTNGSGTGSFTSSLTGLTAGTTYYVRAYAINSVDTAYGSQITFTTTAAPVSYTFSVSSSTRVVFSPGNLQWSAKNGGSTATTHTVAGGGTAAGTWRFAPNQWDTIGTANSLISDTNSGWIDLFGWGTSGYNSKYPYMTSITYSDYGNGNSNISGTNYDWGVYNAIYNPKTSTTDAPGTWRTLTQAEWEYLLNTRSTTSGIRYAKATVNGVSGLIIVPDNWSTSTYALNSTNTTGAAYTTNVITSAQWTTLENAGCAFLPAAGYRGGTSLNYVGSKGLYWSATCYGSGSAYFLNFDSGSVYPSFSGLNRCNGPSVRLVKDVQ